MLDWLRRNYVAVIVSVAIVVSFAIGQHEAEQRAEDARLDNVASCVRRDSNSALFAALVRVSTEGERAQARAARNPEIAREVERFRSFASGAAHYLAIAAYSDRPEKATRVRRLPLEDDQERTATALTRPSERLILRGCTLAFHAQNDDLSNLPASEFHR